MHFISNQGTPPAAHPPTAWPACARGVAVLHWAPSLFLAWRSDLPRNPLHRSALYRAGKRLAALDGLADGRFPHMAAAAIVVDSCLKLAVQLHSSITPKRALRLLQCLPLLLSSGAHWLHSSTMSAGPESGGDPAEPLMRLTQAVNMAVVAASCCWPSCVDGLAASIVTPRLLLSWLAAVGEAVRQLSGEHASTGAW